MAQDSSTLKDPGDVWQGYVFWVPDQGSGPAGWNPRRRGSPYAHGWGRCGYQARAGAQAHAPIWFFVDSPFRCPFCGTRIRFQAKNRGRKRARHILTVSELGSATQR
jgi:hypothetical protein